MNNTVVFRAANYHETGEILIVADSSHQIGAPDPEDVRVYRHPYIYPDAPSWIGVSTYGTPFSFATEAAAVAWATEDGSGWTPADDRPTFEIVLRVQVNESLAQVQSWPWEDLLNSSDAPEIVGVTVESVKEVAR